MKYFNFFEYLHFWILQIFEFYYLFPTRTTTLMFFVCESITLVIRYPVFRKPLVSPMCGSFDSIECLIRLRGHCVERVTFYRIVCRVSLRHVKRINCIFDLLLLLKNKYIYYIKNITNNLIYIFIFIEKIHPTV